MTKHVPTLDEIRDLWVDNHARNHTEVEEYQAIFDAWLVAHNAEVLRSAAERLRQKGVWAPGDGYQHTWEQSHYDWLRDEADRIEAPDHTNGSVKR